MRESSSLSIRTKPGRVAERSIAAVLKTVVQKCTVGSNPTPSAKVYSSNDFSKQPANDIVGPKHFIILI